MARDIYCRWCDWPTEVTADHFPKVCEHCHREGRWTTQPPAPLSGALEPVKPYQITVNDARFLKSIRVLA